jgi:hypothetical protein
MTTIEEAITDRLKSDGDVANIVATSIYPDVAPQSASAPYVVFDLVESEQAASFDGLHNFVESEFDFFCIGTTYAETVALAKAVDLALTDWVDLGDDPPQHGSITTGIRSGVVAAPGDGERRTYRRDVTVTFTHGVDELATPSNT